MPLERKSYRPVMTDRLLSTQNVYRTSLRTDEEQGLNIDAVALQASLKQEEPELLSLQCSLLEYVSDQSFEKKLDQILAHPSTKRLFKQVPKSIIFSKDVSGIFQIAAFRGHVLIMQKLLEAGCDINAVDQHFGTALQAAVFSQAENRKAVVKFLLDPKNDADVKVQGGLYGTPLQAAAYHNDEETAKSLLDRGASVNTVGKRGGNVFEAACIGGNESIIRLLIPSLDISLPCSIHGTPLQAAACAGKKEIVSDLLKKGAKDNITTGLFGTALQAAAKGPNRQIPGLEHEHHGPTSTIDIYLEIVKMLVKEKSAFKAKLKGGHFGSALNAAMFSKSDAMFDLILEMLPVRKLSGKGVQGDSLTYAISKKDDPCLYVRKMLDKGFDVNCNAMGDSFNHPLDIASYYGCMPTVQLLLDRDAYLDAKGGRYGNALRAAVAASKQDIAVYLIDKNADFQSLDQEYGNLLQIAVFKGLERVVRSLLDQNASLRVKDLQRRTVVHVAAWRGSPVIMEMILSKLYENGYSNEILFAKDAWGRTPLDDARAAAKRLQQPDGEDTLWAPKDVESLLIRQMGDEEQWEDTMITGPRVNQISQEKMARPVFTAPFLNDGLGFRAAVVDFYLKDVSKVSSEVHCLQRPAIDSLLYDDNLVYSNQNKMEPVETLPPESPRSPGTKLAGQPKPDDSSSDNIDQPNGKHKLRWIHLPANNMIWAEELINQIRAQKGLPALGRELWGLGSESLSSNIRPHARKILPQYKSIESDKGSSGLKFLATPYLHWEATKPQQDMAAVIENVVEGVSENKANDTNLRAIERELRCAEVDYYFRDSMDHMQLPWFKRYILAISTFLGLDWRRYRTRHHGISIDLLGKQDSHLDNDLLKEYLLKNPPLHIRRTLDQYYYSWLENTASRDRDQVISRHHIQEKKLKATKDLTGYQLVKRAVEIMNREKELYDPKDSGVAPEDVPLETFLNVRDVRNLEEYIASFHNKKFSDPCSPVLIVDQLWIWTFEEFVITSFPQRTPQGMDGEVDPDNRSDILHAILRHLRNPNRAPVIKPVDLVEVIIAHCLTILNRGSWQLPDLDFMGIFSVATSKAVDDAMNLLTTFVSSFEKFKTQPDQSGDSAIEFEKIFSVFKETHLFREVQDIRDELGMLDDLFKEQLKLLNKTISAFNTHWRTSHVIWDTSLHATSESIERNQRDVSKMLIQTEQAYQTLKDLLNLKQQQANVLEARATRRQATATGKQGETIMVFTVVTIIFLPLTFMTTVFQLNIVEYKRVTIPATSPTGSDIVGMKQSYVFGIIVGVTAAISIPLLFIAFNIAKFEKAWSKVTKWGPIRKTFFPETKDKLPFLCEAENELKERDLFCR